jgi:soluble lytic murein transglycosylase
MLQRIIMVVLPVLCLASFQSGSITFPSYVLRELKATGQVAGHFATTTMVRRFLAKRLPKEDEQKMNALAERIVALAYRYDFSPEFILSLVEVESSFRNKAISPRGAVGLLQLKESTARAIFAGQDLPWPGRDSLNNPHYNLEIALHYLAELRDRFKEPRFYITAYNHGPTRISRLIQDGDTLPEGYYRKVMRSYQNVYREVRL